uniref:Uncharacterized protein n=1 Tax=Cacopsylla melanoneura TaxID=428564 RepID=A0A8D9BQ92_9HEMI
MSSLDNIQKKSLEENLEEEKNKNLYWKKKNNEYKEFIKHVENDLGEDTEDERRRVCNSAQQLLIKIPTAYHNRRTTNKELEKRYYRRQRRRTVEDEDLEGIDEEYTYNIRI